LPRPPEQGDYLVDFDKFLKRKGLEDHEAPMEALTRCQNRAWKTADEPLIAEWLRANEAPLKLCVEATKRKRCVAPFVAPADKPLLLHVELGMIQGCRTVLSLLTARAMQHVGEGRIDAAFGDVDTAHRLGTLIGREARTMIESIVADAIRQGAYRTEQVLAFAAKPNDEYFRKRIAAAVYPPNLEAADHIDQFERLVLLNITLYTMVYGGEMFHPPTTQLPNSFAAESIDEALRTVNQYVDKYVAALRKAPGAKSIGELEDDLAKKTRAAKERRDTFFLFRASQPPHPRGPHAAAGEAYAETMLGLLLPAYGLSAHRKLRTTMHERQTILAYALAMHKAKHGRYPQKLDAKVLGVSPEVLIDPYSQKPFADEVKGGKRRIVAREPTNTGSMRIIVRGKRNDQPIEHVLELP
jgi:hypothetical protein